MKWMRLTIFVPTFLVLLKFVSFHRFDRRISSTGVFLCLILALLVVGAIEWCATGIFGWTWD